MATKTIGRIQVRTGAKTWNDRGPDLLRVRRNARSQVRALMAGTTSGWRWRRRPPGKDWTGWTEPGSKSDALKAFDRWGAADGAMMQFAAGNADPVITARAHRIPPIVRPGLTGRAREWYSLVDRFLGDRVTFSGGHVCKRFNGSNDPRVGCSDHAWIGDAADATPEGSARNDRLTDWSVRMARTGNDPTGEGYVLGSRNGKTVSANAPDWEIEADPNIDPSHLWHVHRSLVDHDGRCPCGPTCRLGCK